MGFKRITRGAALLGKGGLTVVAKGTTSIGVLPLADGTGTTTAFAVAGAAFGDHVLLANREATLGGATITAYIAGAGTVGVRIQNESAGTVTLGTAVYGYLVLR